MRSILRLALFLIAICATAQQTMAQKAEISRPIDKSLATPQPLATLSCGGSTSGSFTPSEFYLVEEDSGVLAWQAHEVHTINLNSTTTVRLSASFTSAASVTGVLIATSSSALGSILKSGGSFNSRSHTLEYTLSAGTYYIGPYQKYPVGSLPSSTNSYTFTAQCISSSPTLNAIAIQGSNTVNEGSNLQLSCRAYYSDGSYKDNVSASWSITSGSAYASISSSGLVTAKSVSSDSQVVVTASYSGKTDKHDITVKNTGIVAIDIKGNNTVNEGGTLQLSCRGWYANETYVDNLSVSWSIESGGSYATISSSGLVTAKQVSSDTPVVVRAYYNSVTDKHDITVKNVAVAPTLTIYSSLTNPTSTSPIPITFQFSEEVRNFGPGDVQVINGTLYGFSPLTGTGWSFVGKVTPSSNGTVTVKVGDGGAIGTSSGMGSKAAQFSIDYTPPTISSIEIRGSTSMREAAAIQLTCRVYLTNGTHIDGALATWTITQGANYATISSTGLLTVGDVPSNTRIVVKAAYRDKTDTHNVDVQNLGNRPTVAISSTLTGPTYLAQIPIKLEFSEAVEGLSASEIQLTNATISSFQPSGGFARVFSFIANGLETGMVKVKVPQDAAIAASGLGNASAEFQIEYRKDSVPPTATLAIASRSLFDSPIAVKVTFSETVVDFSATDLTLTNAKILGTSPATLPSQFSQATVYISPRADGDVAISLTANKVRDLAGNYNTGTASTSATYQVRNPSMALRGIVGYSRGINYTAVCTDGASQFAVQLENLPADVDLSEVSITIPSNVATALSNVVVRGPANRMSTGNRSKAERTYRITDLFPMSGSVTSLDAEAVITVRGHQFRLPFQLYRPPVALLHGFNSSSDALMPMRDFLRESGWEFVYAHDYRRTSRSSFQTNRSQAGSAVAQSLYVASRRKVLASKADVVTHSMGGILTRYYIQNLGAYRYRSDIRRFVTLDTPHSGSEWADLLDGLTTTPIIDLVRDIMGGEFWNDAIEDLRVDSVAVDDRLNGPSMATAQYPPTHTFVGVSGFDDRTGGWIGTFWRLMKWLAPYPMDAEDAVSPILGMSNDLIVRASSQRGGMNGSATADHYVPSHISVLDNPTVMEEVVQLLEGTGSEFSSQGIKSPPNLHFALAFLPKSLTNIAHDRSATVEITSPADGTSFAPGTIINVSVSADPTVASVMIASDVQTVIDESLPFSDSIPIPDDFAGSFRITAAGKTPDGITNVDEVTVVVFPTSTLTAIETAFLESGELSAGDSRGIDVYGVFSDGKRINITSSATGTYYSSSDPTIASIDGEGVVTGMAPGNATITVSNRGVHASIALTVISESAVEFSSDASGWVYAAPDPFDHPAGSHDTEAQAVQIVAAGNTNSFGFWDSPLYSIGGTPTLYRAAFTVSTDVPTRALVPEFRLRASSSTFQQSDILAVTSIGEGELSPDPIGERYQLWFQPPAMDGGFRLSFEGLNFLPDNEANGALRLHQVVVEAITTGQLTNEIQALSYDFSAANTRGWELTTVEPHFAAPASRAMSEGLELGGPGTASSDGRTAFGYWGMGDSAISTSAVANRLYAVTFTIGSNAGDSNRDKLPTFRLRMNTASLRLSAYVNIESISATSRLPNYASDQDYTLYFHVPDEVAGERLMFFFDYLNVPESFNDPNIRIRLKKVVVKHYQVQ